jgi:hypothetical protein
MKKTVFLLASLFVMVLATQRVNAQNSDDAQANATATIVAPISITKDIDLQFGKIVRSTSDGTVVIDASATPTPEYTNVSAFTGAGVLSVTAAKFTVNGETGYTYTITLPDDNTVTISGPGEEDMTVTGFTSNPDGTGVLAGGTQTLYVGATLNVGENQAAGDYTGTFNVTVAYN